MPSPRAALAWHDDLPGTQARNACCRRSEQVYVEGTGNRRGGDVLARTHPRENAATTGRLEGRDIPIRTVELCMAWSLLRDRRLQLLDVRVWLACLEVRERRRLGPKGRKPSHTVEELRRLVGGGGGKLKASLRRLAGVGLVTWERNGNTLNGGGPKFATSPEELAAESLETFWQMVSAMPSKRKRVPIPRRTLRMLAGGMKRSVMATAFGQLTYCLYFKKGEGWNPVGACKGSWIADTFGVSRSSVIRARAHLERLGWMASMESPGQWHKNKFGARFCINLRFARTEGELRNTLGYELSTPEMTPPTAEIRPQLTPPESDQTPLARARKHQTPTSAGGGPRAGVSKGTQGKNSPPKLRNMTDEDLADIGRLLELKTQAHAVGIVGGSAADELNFVALAEHARAFGSINAPGLFWRLLNWTRTPDRRSREAAPAWHFVTQHDEDTASRRLREHRFGKPARSGGGVLGQSGSAKKLSEDAALVRAIQARMASHGVLGDVLPQLQRMRPGWTRERWNTAALELRCAQNPEGGI